MDLEDLEELSYEELLLVKAVVEEDIPADFSSTVDFLLKKHLLDNHSGIMIKLLRNPRIELLTDKEIIYLCLRHCHVKGVSLSACDLPRTTDPL